jgi:hypothetical protein
MARRAPEKIAARPLAIPGRADAEADATSWVAGTPARNRSDRSVVKNRRRLHRRALRAGRVTRRRPLRPSPPTRIALRAGTNLQIRNPAKTKATFRRQNHPRRQVPRRLVRTATPLTLLASAEFGGLEPDRRILRISENFVTQIPDSSTEPDEQSPR